MTDAAAVWHNGVWPVVYRKGRGAPVMVKIPLGRCNRREWVQGNHPSRLYPDRDEQYHCWLIPNSWLDDVTRRLLRAFGQLWIIQPYRKQEQCAPACWNARGVVCECSCLGANHGSRDPAGWHVVSETCAVRWNGRQLAMRLIVLPNERRVTANAG